MTRVPELMAAGANDELAQAKSLQSQCCTWFARLVDGSARTLHMGQKWIGTNKLGGVRIEEHARYTPICDSAAFTAGRSSEAAA